MPTPRVRARKSRIQGAHLGPACGREKAVPDSQAAGAPRRARSATQPKQKRGARLDPSGAAARSTHREEHAREARARNGKGGRLHTPHGPSQEEGVLHYVERGTPGRCLAADARDLPLPSRSAAAEDYVRALRAIFMKQRGMAVPDVAAQVGRDEKWVRKMVAFAAAKVKRPHGIAPYVAEYEVNMVRAGIEPFRPALLRRGYVEDSAGLLEECLERMPWTQAVYRNRNQQSGKVTVTNAAASRQNCSYNGTRTGIARLDVHLDRLVRELDIRDPNAYLLCNWYADGKSSISPHQHDFWSAIISFGASRLMMIDDNPVQLHDGDLVVFGTQRHSIPKMPQVRGQRISVAIFYYPERRRSGAGAMLGTHADLDKRSHTAAHAPRLGVGGATHRPDHERTTPPSPCLAVPASRPAMSASEAESDYEMAVRLSLQFTEDGGAGATGTGSHFSHGPRLSARLLDAPYGDDEGDEDEDLQRALALSLAVAED